MHKLRPLVLVLVGMLALGTVVLSGCGQQLQSVSNSDGWFHVRVPDTWQAQAQPTAMLIHASDKMPENEDEAFDSLSVLIISSQTASETPVAEELQQLVDARAESRGWTDVDVSEVKKVTVGKRPGSAVEVRAKDAKKREFAGQIALVRTNGREVLISALAPAKAWEDDAPRVADLYGEWYWHQPEDQGQGDSDKKE